MKLFERIIKRNIRRYLNEWKYTGRRESTNIEDRRNAPPSKLEAEALNIMRRAQPILYQWYRTGHLGEFMYQLGSVLGNDKIYPSTSDKEYQQWKKLAITPVPSVGCKHRDYVKYVLTVSINTTNVLFDGNYLDPNQLDGSGDLFIIGTPYKRDTDGNVVTYDGKPYNSNMSQTQLQPFLFNLKKILPSRNTTVTRDGTTIHRAR